MYGSQITGNTVNRQVCQFDERNNEMNKKKETLTSPIEKQKRHTNRDWTLRLSISILSVIFFGVMFDFIPKLFATIFAR